MKCLTRIAAVFMAVMLLFFCFPVRNVSADDDQDLYVLTDYNSSRVTDPDGNNVRGYSYCLDYKLKMPAGNTYRRMPLSSCTEYSSLEKERLAKLIVYRNDILDYCFNTYGIENVFASERDNFFLPSLSTLNVNSGITDAASFDSSVSYFTDRTLVIQNLIWACVHSDFDSYVHDDGTTVQDGLNHQDHYLYVETSYYYNSPDPINDAHSLWNIGYQPLIDYIDTLDNPLDNGLDIWVYDSVDDSFQDVIGTLITYTDVDVAKTDSDGNDLSGATLQVIDWNGNVVSEWITDGTVHNVTHLYPGMSYTLHEFSAPDGYDKASDISFTVSEDGTLDASGTDTLIMVDNESVIETSTTSSETSQTSVSEITSVTESTAITSTTTTVISAAAEETTSSYIETISASTQVQGAERSATDESVQTTQETQTSTQSSQTTATSTASTGEANDHHIILIAMFCIASGIFCLVIRKGSLNKS